MGRLTEGVRDQIARTLREFEFTPKGCARAYQKPYPEYFDMVLHPLQAAPGDAVLAPGLQAS
jgi:hypothetical protein